MSKIQVEVITPEKLTLKDEVDFVVAPGIDGEIGILPGHTALLSRLGVGELRLRKGNEVTHLALAGGFLEVQPGNRVAIFAETAEAAGEIDVERAQLAAERAKSRLTQSKDLTAEELAQVETALSRAVLRMKLGSIKKRTHQPGQVH